MYTELFACTITLNCFRLLAVRLRAMHATDAMLLLYIHLLASSVFDVWRFRAAPRLPVWAPPLLTYSDVVTKEWAAVGLCLAFGSIPRNCCRAPPHSGAAQT